jgi:pyruvate dehydrogenase E1 component alpha subunit
MIDDRRERREESARIAALDRKALIALYHRVVLIREFEEQVHRSFLAGLVHGTTHLCQGQEAVAAGAIAALRDDDYVTYTYRGHGVCIARGMPPEKAFAELFGRASGVSGGLGGSMHMTDASRGLIGSFGIVGAGLPCAVGAGLSAKLDGKGQVSITFFGDGATNIGAFHEAMNLAAVWSLPIIFVCENNLYGEYTPIRATTPFEDLARRAAAYAMPAMIVDGNDVLAVYDSVGDATERARSGGGPTFVECKTYRQRGHSRTDPGTYRPKEEVAAWLARDPVALARATVVSRGALTDAEAEDLTVDVRREVAAAAAAAADAPWPEETSAMRATYSAGSAP